MRIYALLTLLALPISATATASSTTSMFDCVTFDHKKQEVTTKSECLSDAINKSDAYKSKQQAFNAQLEASNPYVMATMTFHPKKNLIEIVAHRDSNTHSSVR